MTRLVSGGFDDLDGVMRVMTSAFDKRFGEAWTRAQCTGILPMTGVQLTLAENGEQIIGFSLHRSVAGDSELLLLAVDPNAQRKGVGRKLLRHFVDSSRKSGASRVHLEVRDGNPAVVLYETAHFQQAGRRRNYYKGNNGEQFDALTFVMVTEDGP
jgi:ribosomal-protein-alanine N-acetyltransferase